MNMKITKELHQQLCKLDFNEYLFGSRLHGIATETSDSDYIRVISDDFYDNFTSLARYYPNIHSFQYTEGKDIQYIWMTVSQFWNNLFSADGNMIADVVILSGEFENPLHLCRSYRVIKGYLGLVKRDLKLSQEGWDERIKLIKNQRNLTNRGRKICQQYPLRLDECFKNEKTSR